jgi:hypothetical protein
MVDLLAERQYHAEAVQLEALWNSLGEDLPFSLTCGYSSLNFVQARDRASLAPICQAHAGGVSAAPESALGEFLLTSV